MQKGYAAEPLAPVRFRPRSQIQCGIVRIRPKWGSPPTVKVDLFTYRVRLRGRAEGSSTWISERHRHGRRNDSTKASCLDIQASLGALYMSRVAQLVERATCGFMVRSAVRVRQRDQSTGEEGMPQGGAKQLRRLRCIVSLIILYIHIIGEP